MTEVKTGAMPTNPPTPVDVVERLERQLATSADTYEAPSGKIMHRVWVGDLAKVVKLAREALARQAPEPAAPKLQETLAGSTMLDEAVERVARAIRDNALLTESAAKSAARAAIAALQSSGVVGE